MTYVVSPLSKISPTEVKERKTTKSKAVTEEEPITNSLEFRSIVIIIIIIMGI